MKGAIAELIGKHVVAHRTRRGWTQERVAHKAGISRQALSSIERGASEPKWETIYLVAAVLKCEVWDLLPSYGQVRKLSTTHAEEDGHE